eukprot:m.39500 g.39500  ORF g.39500 m.39500 type:complete len:92 (-) comp11279_c0_seq1:91-366(-)
MAEAVRQWLESFKVCMATATSNGFLTLILVLLPFRVVCLFVLLQLERYADAFVNAGYDDPSCIPDLDESDLDAMVTAEAVSTCCAAPNMAE